MTVNIHGLRPDSGFFVASHRARANVVLTLLACIFLVVASFWPLVGFATALLLVLIRFRTTPLFVLMAATGLFAGFNIVGLPGGKIVQASQLLLLVVLAFVFSFSLFRNFRLGHYAGPLVLIVSITLPSLEVFRAQGLTEFVQVARFQLIPVAAYLLGALATKREISLFLRVAVIVMVLNTAAAIYQHVFGVRAILSSGKWGFSYGTQLREIGRQIRAPGFMQSGFELGIFSAFLVSAFLAMLVYRLSLVSRHWLVLGVVFGACNVILSTSRTAFVIILASLVYLSLRSSRYRTAILTLAVVILSFVGAVAGFDTTSIGARVGVWRSLTSQFGATHGLGMGEVGVASKKTRLGFTLAVDNYYLSALVQFGVIIGLAIVLGIFLCFYNRSADLVTQKVLRCLSFGLGVSMFFLETWEYITAMTFLLSLAGYLNVKTAND